MNYYQGTITNLEPHEVFVFGANPQGFHGAGSAGYATFGIPGNQWRRFNYDKWPDGTLGKWNVKGKIGPQRGKEGASYGLVTVLKAGAKRSIVPDFTTLFECCRKYDHRTFYLAQTANTGLNGWTGAEMAQFMKSAGPIPDNLHLNITMKPFFE